MDQKRSFITVWSIILAVLVFSGCGQPANGTIKIGGLWDLTGPTSDASILYSDGERGYIDYVNRRGGINGRKVELFVEDYAYNLLRAEELYDRLVREHHVIAILGWGTGDAQALVNRVALDRIPLFPCNTTDLLSDVRRAPYNFMTGPGYADQMRVALKHINDNWHNSSRRPRVAFFYSNTAAGTSPLEAGRAYAKANDMVLVSEQLIALTDLNASSQINAIEKLGGADFGIINQTSSSVAVIVRSARKMKNSMKFVALNMGVDEKALALMGSMGEGLLGVSPYAFPQAGAPFMEEINEYLEEARKPKNSVGIHFVQGWLTAKVLLEAIKRSGDQLTGKAIHDALENMSDFDPKGITGPFMYRPSSHQGSNLLRVYQVKNGRWEFVAKYDQ